MYNTGLTKKGEYVAIVEGTNGKQRAVQFLFPGEQELVKNGALPGLDARWYYLNVVDSYSLLIAVYAAEIFADLRIGRK